MSALQPRKIVPPIYFFLALIAIVGLHKYFPVAQMLEPPISFAGAGLIALGIAIAAWAARAFGKAGTPVVPFHQSTSLVTGGLYRYTRNPMYVGITSILTAEAILFSSAVMLGYAAAAFVVFHLFILGYEEPTLAKKFGESYEKYCRNVPRWVGRA